MCVVVKVCLHEGVWCYWACLWLFTVNGNRTFKVEPVCLLQVGYLSTWSVFLASVTAWKTRHWLTSLRWNILLELRWPRCSSWNNCSMDPEVSFISWALFIFFSGLPHPELLEARCVQFQVFWHAGGFCQTSICAQWERHWFHRRMKRRAILCFCTCFSKHM